MLMRYTYYLIHVHQITKTMTDTIDQLENELYNEYRSVYGEKVDAVATAAQTIERARLAIINARLNVESIDAKQKDLKVDAAKVESIKARFETAYPPVEVSDALKRRHPDVFGLYDHRSKKRKEEDRRFDEKDAEKIEQVKKRKEAAKKLTQRTNDMIDGTNTAITMVTKSISLPPTNVQWIDRVFEPK